MMALPMGLREVKERQDSIDIATEVHVSRDEKVKILLESELCQHFYDVTDI